MKLKVLSVQNFRWKNIKGRESLGDLNRDGRKCDIRCERVECYLKKKRNFLTVCVATSLFNRTSVHERVFVVMCVYQLL
jgi:hypothetical protein